MSYKSDDVPIFTVLFFIFLVLKLAEIGPVATWSWWWVTAPLWGPLIVVIALGSFYVLNMKRKK